MVLVCQLVPWTGRAQLLVIKSFSSIMCSYVGQTSKQIVMMMLSSPLLPVGPIKFPKEQLRTSFRNNCFIKRAYESTASSCHLSANLICTYQFRGDQSPLPYPSLIMDDGGGRVARDERFGRLSYLKPSLFFISG